MQKVNRYPVMLWCEVSTHRLGLTYKRLQSRFHKLHAVVDEYWLPGQRNRDRLLRECRERALNDARALEINKLSIDDRSIVKRIPADQCQVP